MSTIMEKLQAPFMPDEIEWRVGSTTKDKTKGLALAYVTNRAIQNRLDEIFGCFGWKNEYKEWKGQSQLCGISIIHEGVWITKWDGADNSNMDATKGGLSDAMKRAAYQWGIGRYLYKLESVWMPIKQQGSSYTLVGTPPLPQWALPSGCKQTTTTQKGTDPPPSTQTTTTGKPAASTDTISEKQGKRMIAIAQGNPQIVNGILKDYGYVRMLQVKRKDYDEMCAKVEALAAGGVSPDYPTDEEMGGAY